MNKKFFSKSQISIIEISFVVLLFIFVSSYFYFDAKTSEQDHKFSVDSALDSIYYSEDYRDVIMDENLSVTSVTEDWSEMSTLLNKTFSSYEVVISNNSVSKTIFSCDEVSGKYFAQRVISIKDNDNYEFRSIRLGVCY